MNYLAFGLWLTLGLTISLWLYLKKLSTYTFDAECSYVERFFANIHIYSLNLHMWILAIVVFLLSVVKTPGCQPFQKTLTIATTITIGWLLCSISISSFIDDIEEIGKIRSDLKQKMSKISNGTVILDIFDAVHSFRTLIYHNIRVRRKYEIEYERSEL